MSLPPLDYQTPEPPPKKVPPAIRVLMGVMAVALIYTAMPVIRQASHIRGMAPLAIVALLIAGVLPNSR